MDNNADRQFSLLRTNISKAYWCMFDTKEKITKFAPARSKIHGYAESTGFLNTGPKITNFQHEISWFDSLFNEGGLKIGGDVGNPISLLITGLPGSGKSTLGLELCIRIAQFHDLWSLYISSESDSNALRSKIEAFGIPGTRERTISFSDEISINYTSKPTRGMVTLYGQEHVNKELPFTDIVKNAKNDVFEWIENSNNSYADFFLQRPTNKYEKIKAPPIIVFDSLNMIGEPWNRNNPIDSIVKEFSGSTKLLVIILSDEKNSHNYRTWEIACDNIIHLDYNLIKLDNTSMRDYYRRSIEVVKARYQGHKWGIHQMKLYEASNWSNEAKETYNSSMRRAHPYREEGGIFIFPSIHSFLSSYKRIGTESGSSRYVPTPSEGLNELIEGFPKGRCTALMGIRGGHKSHLAYHHLLRQVTRDYLSGNLKNAGLVISLRDDEGITREHINKILTEEIKIGKYREYPHLNPEIKDFDAEKAADKLLEDLLRENLLEILYFPPGYITPDEFFHRMFMSIFRFKEEGKRIHHGKMGVTVMFNSLDQLAARFPLCAHQPIFIPAMIHCLAGEEVTSIFIAVNEPGQPEAQYGLLPMADLILSFKRERISDLEYYQIHKKDIPTDIKKEETREEIVLEVSRFAGGKKAGTKGLLELVYSDQEITKTLLKKDPGLHFTKWE